MRLTPGGLGRAGIGPGGLSEDLGRLEKDLGRLRILKGRRIS